MSPPPQQLVSKRQATVETATYGSEFVAAKTTKGANHGPQKHT